MFVNFGDNRRCGFNPPTYSSEDKLQVCTGNFAPEFFKRGFNGLAKDVVILKKITPDFLSQDRSSFHEPGITLPSPGIEEPLLFLFRKSLLQGRAIFSIVLFVARAPFGEPFPQRLLNTGEVFEQGLTKLII